ncbi:MAG: AmmeMemoRadiSam system protein B [Candidatus Rifleibacteriota bacterium]
MHSKRFSLLFLFLFLFNYSAVFAADRLPVIAGSFYPADKAEINQQIKSFLSEISTKTQIEPDADLITIIVPHAGWIYSGKTAARAFKAIKDIKFSDCIFVGVDHRVGLAAIGLWPDGNYLTPIGKTPVSEFLTAKLIEKSEKIISSPPLHSKEHSLEVLLPFFQHFFPEKPAVFSVCSGPTDNGIIFADALAEILPDRPGKTLLIVSTDWSHYHSEAKAEKLDKNAIKSVLNFDKKTLLKDCHNKKAELCGLNGVICAMHLMKQASSTARLLEYTDSSKASGDASRVVGYAAILMQGYKNSISGKLPTTKENKKMTFEQEALQTVRRTLEAHLQGKPIPDFKFNHEKFQQKYGVFVTLKKGDELRGCIGFIKGIEPLADAIPEMAISAATKDPRFNPITYEELKDIKIEISVLTPMTPVEKIDEIEIGKHGLMLQLGPNSGLLLPQVPVEWDWDVKEFLDNLCLKAGLPPGAHKHPQAKLEKFSAQVFSE